MSSPVLATLIFRLGSKSPGLIVLEHELTSGSVQSFIDNYPSIISNGWTPMSVTQIIGNGTVYQNSQNAFSPVTMATGVLPVDIVSSTSTLSPTTTANTTTTAKPTTTSSSWGMVASTANLSRVVLAVLGVMVTANSGLVI
jgi:chitin deacetylase